MAKLKLDKDLMKEVKALNKVVKKGDLGKFQDAAKKMRKTIGPIRKVSRYDCGQCVVCAVCIGTPTPDIDIAAVTGVAML